MKKIICVLAVLAAIASQWLVTTPEAAVFFPAAAVPINAITPQMSVSRSSGISPMAVEFDASGTTASTLTSNPFQEIEYHFDAGDGSAGVYQNGLRAGQSTNTYVGGPEFGHLYVCADGNGTCHYTACVYAIYGSFRSAVNCQSIAVQDQATAYPGAATHCWTTQASVGSACPSGATPHTSVSSLETICFALNSGSAQQVRYLLRRGDVFSATGANGCEIKIAGPGVIGAYDTGAKPFVGLTSTGAALINAGCVTNPSNCMSDWVIQDIEWSDLLADITGTIAQSTSTTGILTINSVVSGTVRTNALLGAGVGASGQLKLGAQIDSTHWNLSAVWGTVPTISSPTDIHVIGGGTAAALNTNNGGATRYRITFYNNQFDDWQQGILITGVGSTGAQPNLMSIIQNTFRNGSGEQVYGTYMQAIVMDNLFDGIMNAGPPGNGNINVIRMFPYIAFLGSNSFPTGTQDSNASMITIRTNGQSTAGKLVIADSYLVVGTNNNGIAVNSANSGDTPNTNVVIERNWVVAHAIASSPAYKVGEGTGIVVRNNVASNIGAGSSFINDVLNLNIANNGTLTMENNTAYSGVSGTGMAFLTMCDIACPGFAGTVTAKNNLVYYPQATSPVLINGTQSGAVTESNNTGNGTAGAGSIATNPGFTGTLPPATLTDWQVSSSSYGNGHGASVPVWSDLFLTPWSPTWSIGCCHP